MKKRAVSYSSTLPRRFRPSGSSGDQDVIAGARRRYLRIGIESCDDVLCVVVDVAYFDSGFHIIGEAGKCSAKKLIGGGVDADSAVFLLLPYEWMEFETERSKPVMDISEIDEPISAAGALPARFDITAEIVAFIHPDEDLADCLYP